MGVLDMDDVLLCCTIVVPCLATLCFILPFCAMLCYVVPCCALLCYVDVWQTVRRIYISGLELKKNVNVFCLPMEHRVIEL